MSETIDQKTIAKLLSSAEFLFSQKGYDGTSVREVTQKAGVNLAAINYHFTNKEGLYCEVLARHLRPINQGRLEKLKTASELAGNNPVPLPLIIDLFSRPLFELCGKTEAGGLAMLRLIGRSMVEPLPFVDELFAKEFNPVTMRFSQAIRLHVPALTAEEFMWRLNFVVGAMHHTLATMHRMKDLTHGLCQNHDATAALRHFIHFAVATLTSPGTQVD